MPPIITLCLSASMHSTVMITAMLFPRLSQWNSQTNKAALSPYRVVDRRQNTDEYALAFSVSLTTLCVNIFRSHTPDNVWLNTKGRESKRASLKAIITLIKPRPTIRYSTYALLIIPQNRTRLRPFPMLMERITSFTKRKKE